MTAERNIVFRATDIEKRYGGVHALKGVNFDIAQGEVTTLFGENGAGKSTLMKILSGVEQPTAGRLELDGERVEFASPIAARDRGVSIIHQELSLAPNLNVRDNIFMGREKRTRAGGVDYKAERLEAMELLDRLNEPIDPDTPVSELRLGQQQIIEIARALSVNSRILIMDEPTSALSAVEVEVLFKVIHDLTASGVSIVYISHHLEEALQITDVAVVLRDGEMVAAEDATEVDLEWIVTRMVGGTFDPGSRPDAAAVGDVALRIDDVRVADPTKPERMAVDGVSLDVHRGEIVCIYGLMGAGRTELLEAVAGRDALAGGDVYLEGRSLRGQSIAQRIKLGLGLVPEDRQRDGLVQTMSVGNNMSLANLGALLKNYLLSKAAETRLVSRGVKSVRVKTPSQDAKIGALSGGNQQKVVIGKILLTDPKVFLLDEPSRGIDVGAKAEVFGLLAELAREGLAVLYSTSEAEEALGIAHRTVVMRRGRIAAEFDAARATKEEVMAASGEAVAGTTLNGQPS